MLVNFGNFLFPIHSDLLPPFSSPCGTFQQLLFRRFLWALGCAVTVTHTSLQMWLRSDVAVAVA